MTHSYTKVPGAWERHLIRRHKNPHYFNFRSAPTDTEIVDAQMRDQQELAKFLQSLESLIHDCTQLSSDMPTNHIASLKTNLDTSHDMAYGLSADLSPQIAAITTLTEVINTAIRNALAKDENQLAKLDQEDESRQTHLKRLEHPIVCDLLRTISPIPQGELASALLSEPKPAFKAALAILATDRKKYLAQRMDTIISTLEFTKNKNYSRFIETAQNKRSLLKQQLSKQHQPVAG